MDEEPIVSVVIPLYQSRSNFERLVEFLQHLFALLGSGSELLLINDGDPDLFHVSSYTQFQSIDVPLTVLQLKNNFGQMTATMCGINAAKCPVVLTIDADPHYEAATLKELVLQAQTPKHLAYIDIVRPTQKRPIFRNALSWTNKKVFEFLVKNVSLQNYSGSSIRAIEGSLAKKFLEEGHCAEMMDVWLLNTARKVSFIPYLETTDYNSTYSFNSLFLFILRFIKCFFSKKKSLKATDYIYQIEKFTV